MAPSPDPVPADAVVVGRVGGSYGVRGWLRVEPFNDPHDSVLLHARRWHLRMPANLAAAPRGVSETPQSSAIPGALPAVLDIEQCRVHGAGLVARAAQVEAREAADALRGCEISVSRTEFPAADEDEFYWVDLIGCTVVTPSGVELGVVGAVDDHGAHPLLGVHGSDGRERLIPFVAAHIAGVDLSARRIVADWDPDF